MGNLSILIAVIVFLAGLFNLLFPHIAWKFQHMLHVRGGEPTTFYLIMSRVSGFILIVISVFMFMGYLH